jgi:hypothetical protein
MNFTSKIIADNNIKYTNLFGRKSAGGRSLF